MRYACVAWFSVFLLSFFGSCQAKAADAGSACLRAQIIDAETGSPTACTVAITDAHGKLVTERESFKSGFRCSGQFEKELPAGLTKIRITRGFETAAVEKAVELKANTTNELRFALVRRVDLRRRGWYAGDSHVHMIHGEKNIPVDFDFVALTARAEDLQYLSLSHNWALKDPTPEILESELKARSTPLTQLTWNLEAPKNYYRGDVGRCLGHCWTLGMRGRTAEEQNIISMLLNASAVDYYESEKEPTANFEIQRLIHLQGGAVFYTHPARWWTGTWGGGIYPKRDHMRISNLAVELPLDLLVGPSFDGIDLITGGGELEANGLAFELWALLLNHGYHLSPTASSDACFDRAAGGIPGVVRTYTYLENGFSFPAVAQATAAGKTFVSSGPLLLATLDQQPPGAVFAANSASHTMQIEAWSSGADGRGLSRLEVLRQGRVFQAWDFTNGSGSFQTNLVLREKEDAWYCVRLFGSDRQHQRAISGAFYFESPGFHPPEPVRAAVQARIVDAGTGHALPGTLKEITYCGTLQQDGPSHDLTSGSGSLVVPGTVRLRASAPGYRPVTLSPFFDDPVLLDLITHLESKDLVQWMTYERIRERLGKIQLLFQMERESEKQEKAP